MTVERARRREFAELVADHLLGHLHRDVLVAVVDAEQQSDELRQDCRAAAPNPDHLVPTRPARGLCLLGQIAVHKRTFPNRTRHVRNLYFFLRTWRLATMNFWVRLLLRVFLPLVG